MPTYDYKCPRCDKAVEIFHTMMQPSVFVCDICKTTLIKQISKGAGVIYKGDGFTKQRKE